MLEHAKRDLILITGPGRSGTSALAGMLSMLGVHIPGPLVAANRSNERGFYETRWVVDYQKALLTRAYSYEFDGDPHSRLRVAEVVTDETRSTMTDWLRIAAADSPLLAIKDPRSIWFHDLWTAAAAQNDYRIVYLTTLRHPAEVVGSRAAYYNAGKPALGSREYTVAKVAGWVHVTLLNEHETRTQPRSFVRYEQLIDDWRSVAVGIEDDLRIRFPAGPGAWQAPHPVDDFLSPRLHRITTTWDDLDCPESLELIARQTWEACLRIAADGRDEDTDAVFDDLVLRYRRLYRDSAEIVSDRTTARVDQAKARTVKRIESERATDAARRRRLYVSVGGALPRPVRLLLLWLIHGVRRLRLRAKEDPG